MSKEIEGLTSIIYKTVGDISQWYEVLHHICSYTGASKGIIALRNRQTAKLVIPSNIWHDLTSPLLYGFSVEEVEEYIKYYAEHDPWTEYEKLFHPSEPYALSQHIKLQDLRESIFWNWLEPQKIDDTITLEIGTSHPNWVAMNLFYDTQTPGVKECILELTEKYQSIMNDAWHRGQQLRALDQGHSRLTFFLEQQSSAALVLEYDGKVVSTNGRAKELFNVEHELFRTVEGIFAIGSKVLRSEFDEALTALSTMPESTPTLKLDYENYQLQLTLMERSEDVIGIDKNVYLLSIKNYSDEVFRLDAPPWEHSSLTGRERQLVEILANGGKIVDFINKYKLAKSTGHLHWGNAKRKLKVTKMAEIYTAYQIFLKNL